MDMTTTTDAESQEQRKPKSIDGDLLRVLPRHLTSTGQRGLPAVARPIHLRGQGSGPRRAEDIHHRLRPLDRL